jgi:hypothetical protein
MGQVLASRDDNWKKLQQYVLEERELVELTGPGRMRVWGEQRDYAWYIRTGFFVRSPVKFNGVAIGENDRRKYEDEYLRRQQERERRFAAATGAPAPPLAGGSMPPIDGNALLQQTRQPQFISSAYFLRFKFEEGKYALVGHEMVGGRDTLRIEYYPARLFTGTARRGRNPNRSDLDRAYDAEFQRLMNKVALVTLWVEPNARQIVQYTFDNIALDFLPVQWFVHVNSFRATMTMGEPFSDVWLPDKVEAAAAVTIALGQFDVHYTLDYHDYRRADITTKVGIPGAR